MVAVTLLAALSFGASPEEAPETWKKCAEAYRALKSYKGDSENFLIIQGVRHKASHGAITYKAPKEFDFTYHDIGLGVSCTLSQTSEGKWQGSASEDVPSVFPGSSNAAGFVDDVVELWPYAPLAFALNENTRIYDSFTPQGTTVEEKMDNVLCLRVTDGPPGEARTIIWMEKSTRLLRRIRQEFKEGSPELTVFKPR
ncbi:hypothetical protein EON81_11370 [bacterium]|nr:MAG: hypothetical protein EON81_11370 [bacterium]